MIVKGKKISRCYHECPYFGLEGGPGSIMVCLHPTLKGLGIEDAAIISHPDCDTGFPVKCPEKRLQERPLEAPTTPSSSIEGNDD